MTQRQKSKPDTDFKIPEKYVRYQASSSALSFCVFFFFPGFGAILIDVALILFRRKKGAGELTDVTGTLVPFIPDILFLLIISYAIGTLVYWLFIREPRRRQFLEAQEEAVQFISDPVILDEIAKVPKDSDSYEYFITEGLQEFELSFLFSMVFFAIPSAFLVFVFVLPVDLMLTPLESFAKENGMVFDPNNTLDVCLALIPSSFLWYRFAYRRFYRWCIVRKLKRKKSKAIKAAREGAINDKQVVYVEPSSRDKAKFCRLLREVIIVTVIFTVSFFALYIFGHTSVMAGSIAISMLGLYIVYILISGILRFRRLNNHINLEVWFTQSYKILDLFSKNKIHYDN